MGNWGGRSCDKQFASPRILLHGLTVYPYPETNREGQKESETERERERAGADSSSSRLRVSGYLIHITHHVSRCS